MSLKNILVELASIGAIQLGNAEQLLLATNQVNKAAEELYKENDLIVPLLRDIENAGPLSFTFKAPLLAPLTITVVGATENAAQYTETLSLLAGQSTAVTLQSFESVSSIAKSLTTNSDCDVTDIDGLLLATIPNNQLKVLYTMVEIINNPTNSAGNGVNAQPIATFVELLWKPRYNPMVALTDEFQLAGYDTAIFWKWKEHRCLYKENPDTQGALTCLAQASKIVKDIANNHDQNLKKSMNFGSNPIYQAFEGLECMGLMTNELTPQFRINR